MITVTTCFRNQFRHFKKWKANTTSKTQQTSLIKEAASESIWYRAVLVWCGKSVKFDRVCRTFVELNLGSTHGTPSESDVAPVSLQSRTYSIRFGTWKIRRLNQALPYYVRDGHQYEAHIFCHLMLCISLFAYLIVKVWVLTFSIASKKPLWSSAIPQRHPDQYTVWFEAQLHFHWPL